MVFEDNVPEIRSLIAEYPHTIFYLPSSAESCGIRASEQVSLIRLAHGHRFSTNISSLTDFGNVGATALQILAILGYRRIAMIGVDARYIAVDATSVVADADGFVIANNDTNHFCPEYARGKRRLAHPDYERILGQWPQVAKECADNAIEVRNASPGSALEFFPITDFAAAIDWVRGDSTEQRRDC